MPDSGGSSLKIRDWDAATKFASIVALLIGGLWSVWLFHATAKQQANSAEIEAQKPFATKRLAVYEQLTTLTATVAQLDLPAETRKQKRQELDEIINGQLALVTQDAVFGALRDFVACADNRHCTKGSLALYSRNVARACRKSLEESWNVNLPPVPASDSLP